MARRYLFSDESGDMAFRRSGNSSRYFAVGTLSVDEPELGRLRAALAGLRDELAWHRHGLNSSFHACEDRSAVRQAVFALLAHGDFRIDVTLLEKAKAPEPMRRDRPACFKGAWRNHLRAIAPQLFNPGDEVLIVAASLGTRRERRAFRGAIEDSMKRCVPYRVKRTLAFWRDESDFALQAVDYCLWAVTRKWERGDDSYYKYIAAKIAIERDLWHQSKRFYY